MNRINLLDNDKKRVYITPSKRLYDQAIKNENDEVVVKLDLLDRVELKNVNAALKRITIGKFGVCASCGKEIDTKRREAVPYAVNCIECENSK